MADNLNCKILKVDTDYFGREKIIYALENLDGVFKVDYRAEKNFIEIFMDRNNEVTDQKIIDAVNGAGDFKIFGLD